MLGPIPCVLPHAGLPFWLSPPRIRNVLGSKFLKPDPAHRPHAEQPQPFCITWYITFKSDATWASMHWDDGRNLPRMKHMMHPDDLQQGMQEQPDLAPGNDGKVAVALKVGGGPLTHPPPPIF